MKIQGVKYGVDSDGWLFDTATSSVLFFGINEAMVVAAAIEAVSAWTVELCGASADMYAIKLVTGPPSLSAVHDDTPRVVARTAQN